jgi:hypothetical protein
VSDGGAVSDDDAGGDDNMGSSDGEDINPWRKIVAEVVIKTKRKYMSLLERYLQQDKLPLARARQKTYIRLHDYILDAFQKVYLQRLRFQRALRRDTINQKIQQTARRFRREEDFSFDDSVECALKQRRYLLSKVMDKTIQAMNDDLQSYAEGEEKEEAEMGDGDESSSD